VSQDFVATCLFSDESGLTPGSSKLSPDNELGSLSAHVGLTRGSRWAQQEI